MSEEQKQEGQALGAGLMIAGYIFALLGGLIGLLIGAYIKMGKGPGGGPKYDEAGQKHGLIILVVAIVSMVGWNVLRFAG